MKLKNKNITLGVLVATLRDGDFNKIKNGTPQGVPKFMRVLSQ